MPYDIRSKDPLHRQLIEDLLTEQEIGLGPAQVAQNPMVEASGWVPPAVSQGTPTQQQQPEQEYAAQLGQDQLPGIYSPRQLEALRKASQLGIGLNEIGGILASLGGNRQLGQNLTNQSVMQRRRLDAYEGMARQEMRRQQDVERQDMIRQQEMDLAQTIRSQRANQSMVPYLMRSGNVEALQRIGPGLGTSSDITDTFTQGNYPQPVAKPTPESPEDKRNAEATIAAVKMSAQKLLSAGRGDQVVALFRDTFGLDLSPYIPDNLVTDREKLNAGNVIEEIMKAWLGGGTEE